MTQIDESTDAILGQEFLTWLWFKSDTEPGSFVTSDGTPFTVSMEQRIVVQGGQGDAKETASVAGSMFSPMREARFGLGTGKKVTRALLHLEKDDLAFQVTLKAEDFSLGSMKTPKLDKTDADEDPEALFLEKIYLMESCVELVDSLYRTFLSIRLKSVWEQETQAIRQWLTSND